MICRRIVSFWRQYRRCERIVRHYRGVWRDIPRSTWNCIATCVCDVGVGDGPLVLTARLQTQLSRLLEEHQSLLESVNKPEATTI